MKASLNRNRNLIVFYRSRILKVMNFVKCIVIITVIFIFEGQATSIPITIMIVVTVIISDRT